MDSAVSPTVANLTENRGPRWRQRALGVLLAALAAVVIWVVAVPLAGMDLDATMAEGQAPTRINLGMVVAAALIISLLGWALLALLERVSRHGLRIWVIVAVIFLLLSLAGPTMAETGGAMVALALMHLAVGGVLIAAMIRSARR
ncbi:hypothetical protein FXF53_14005 [Micromonospora sp. WP24]|uniref:DUF6069 family protein n=1 Tax=Micromonospora sp. WP24 TaxID=2604469 RepID=UPI0011D52B99|nr:DUF6069 family protein [Micromonospora sp. WP24]TYC00285.1 hypothetical protein FXF53_14005 [Micromonospora sp. WP24]